MVLRCPAMSIRRLRTKFVVIGVVVATTCLLGQGRDALADLTISSQQTSNVSCANGVCAPTASKATLNVSDLQNLLAAGNVTVTTTGSGVQAHDLVLKASLTWSSASAL